METTAEIPGLPIQLRRTTVTVLPPDRRPDPEPDAEKADLLSLYNIGTVPASVTPPASWRKAAWFAMVSSAGVIAALLVASTYLVQHQQTTQNNGQKWTGLEGGADDNTAAKHPIVAGHPHAIDDAKPASAGQPQVIDDVVHVRTSAPAAGQPDTTTPSPVTVQGSDAVTAPDKGTGGKHRATTAPTPVTSTPTQKSPSSTTSRHAPRETEPAPLRLVDPKQMGRRTVAFLQQVTEDSKKALEQTAGLLRLQGAESLERRYASISDFTVEKVYVQTRDATTINTVRTAYTNGHVAHEQRTLRFDLTNHIVHD